jgi:membrane-associated phospholipid phosphatase
MTEANSSTGTAVTVNADTPVPLVKQNIGATIVLLAAAGLFALIARKVERGETEQLDERVHEELQSHRLAPLDVAAKPVTLLSLPLLIVAATAGLVWWLRRDGRNAAALTIALTPVAAAAVGQSFTLFLDQRNPPDKAASTNEAEVTEPSFPSGHTTGVTAEALSIAYILRNEGLASPAILAALLGWPLLVGVTRIYRDRHWISDVLAGWIAGTAVAAGSALLYGALAQFHHPAQAPTLRAP